MSLVNQTIPTLKPENSTQAIQDNSILQINKAIASALRNYNEHIRWLNEQIQQGHLNQAALMALSIKSFSPKTHKSPIEEALDALYSDPLFVSLTEELSSNLPNHFVHLIAKQLTLNLLSKTDFPPICTTSTKDNTHYSCVTI